VDATGNALCHTVCPLAATIADGESRETSLWLRHRDGYRKPVRVRTMPVRDSSGSIIGGVETFSDDSAVLRAMEDADRVRRDSLTDELTGLPNRRLFDAVRSWCTPPTSRSAARWRGLATRPRPYSAAPTPRSTRPSTTAGTVTKWPSSRRSPVAPGTSCRAPSSTPGTSAACGVRGGKSRLIVSTEGGTRRVICW
jgi:hypothetical protein